jgi:hypothetical protein
VKSLGANSRINGEPFTPKVVEHLDAKVRQQGEMRNDEIAGLLAQTARVEPGYG